jgi:hypothetical protein
MDPFSGITEFFRRLANRLFMKKTYLRTLIIFALCSALPCLVFAKSCVWNLKDGTTFEAELVTVMSDKAVFKTVKRKVVKLPLDQFSDESLLRIELEMPPKLDIEFINSRSKVNFPAGASDAATRPPEVRAHYGVRIKQTNVGNYDHELNVELFAIGIERLGDKYILLDRQSTPFTLTAENKKTFEFRSERGVVLRNFLAGAGQSKTPRGERYYGYLAVVKDVRGETIAVGASHDWLFENIENLSKRTVGNYMDETCARVFPTRPPPWNQ